MAQEHDTGEFKSNRSDAWAVDPEGISVDWTKNISRDGKKEEEDADFIQFARSLLAPPIGRGQIQPVTVRKLGDGKLQLLTGFRRMQAALYLKRSGLDPSFKIKYLVSKKSDEEAVLDNFTENCHRKDPDVLSLARALRVLMEHYSLSMDEILVKTNMSRQWVEKVMQVLQLHPELQAAVEKKELAATAALELAQLPTEAEQKEVYDAAKKQKGKDLAVKHAKKAAKNGKPGKLFNEQEATKGKKVSATEIKDAKRKRLEEKVKRGEAPPEALTIKRRLKDVITFLSEQTGAAEPIQGRKLAQGIIDFINSKRTDEAMQRLWTKTFAPVDVSK